MTQLRARGLVFASMGMLAFSFTFPATTEALHGFSAPVIGIGRAVGAAALAGCCLLVRRVPLPSRADLMPLVIVAAGVVIGFPLLTALALQHVTSSHAAVVTGLLPVATAAFGVLRARERPGPLFWAAAVAGAVIVIAYILHGGASGGASHGASHGAGFSLSDLLLLGSLVSGGAGYTEGGMLARRMPGWQVISWALMLALPVTVPVTVAALVIAPPHPAPGAAAGFGYVCVFSMFLGFFAWYRGLADAGVARASQVQLAQPLLTVLWSAVLLGERLTGSLLLAAAGVLACVGAAQGSSRASSRAWSRAGSRAWSRAWSRRSSRDRLDPRSAPGLTPSPAASARDPGAPGTAGWPPEGGW
jgi:drug/metabolite transporter (DMT)-like permease